MLDLFTYSMDTISKQDQKIAKMTFASIYPHYVSKVEKKNRSKDELHKVIEWLTGFNFEELKKLIEQNITFETFFMNATLNENAHLITGTICGYKIEEIKNPITKQVRYLDKLVDELAKGKEIDKILRK
jgi:hypothetical protein|tara:strand:+ start:99 stop:485 length:387 start_codon:yes stop_codon:yes gene_type:complete